MSVRAGVFAVAVCVVCGCGDDDATPTDAGLGDAGEVDSGASDAGSPDAGLAHVMAMTESGPVIGLDRGTSLVFRGVPYAAPPVGALRFAPPAAPTPWTMPIDATGMGTKCRQQQLLATTFEGTEDCLQLDVWTPALTGSRPVMVWIHGGGFTSGSGHFESTRIVEEGDVVVVGMNYRLGALGFLAHPGVAGAGETTGNWGLLDQQAALRWVRANAAHFGGDPANVTIFGQSAGGSSVLLQTMARGSETLFEHAIEQSGPFSVTTSRADAEAVGARAAAELGCTGDIAACLRAADADAVLAAPAGVHLPGGEFYDGVTFQYQPTVDGVVLDATPIARLRAHTTADVPMIIGATTDEATILHNAIFGIPVTDEAEYRAVLVRLTGMLHVAPTFADTILAEYPVAAYASANDALTHVSTDGAFICQTRHTARLLTEAGRAVYLYHFDQAPARVAIAGLGVFHGADLVFLFGNSSAVIGNPTSAPTLGPAMRGYWTRFAATGDPGGTPAWPIWSPTTDVRLHLSATIDTETAYVDAKCDFWDSIYAAI